MNGFFINLSESLTRRHAIESQIQKFGLTNVIKRFNAVKFESNNHRLTNSVMGCLLSHLEIIRNSSNSDHLLILEDDVVLSKFLDISLQKINSLLSETDIDILFLGHTILSNDISKHIKMLNLMSRYDLASKSINLIESKNLYRFGTFAYIINSNSLNKIRALLKDIEFTDNLIPFDDFVALLINSNKLKSKIVFPYLVGLEPDHPSTLYDRENTGLHQSHCNLVNMYFKDQIMKVQTIFWRSILDNKPNHYALKVALEIYNHIKNHT